MQHWRREARCYYYLKQPTSDILKNKLKLDPSAVAGEGEYARKFLCIEVSNSGIPVSLQVFVDASKTNINVTSGT